MAELPPESKSLMQKLAQFTEEQSAASQVRVMEKRIAVDTLLEDLLVTETKRGNLEEANAINDSKKRLSTATESASDILKANLKLPDSSRSYLEKLAEFETGEKAKSPSIGKPLRKNATDRAVSSAAPLKKTISKCSSLSSSNSSTPTATVVSGWEESEIKLASGNGSMAQKSMSQSGKQTRVSGWRKHAR